MRRVVTMLFAALAASGVAQAQAIDPSEYEKFLLPVLAETTNGAYGSQWYSYFFMHNAAPVPAAFYPIFCPYSPCPADSTWYIPPGQTGGPSTEMSRGDQPGLLFYVKNDVAPHVSFNLRSRDMSRHLDTWGTEIPVVRETELFEVESITLVSVPLAERVRSILRIYDVDAKGDSEVMVRIYDDGDGSLLLARPLTLVVPIDNHPIPTKPGYAQISPTNELAPVNRVLRIKIEPITAGLRYWAFVSVTNNETQHVTTITPQ